MANIAKRGTGYRVRVFAGLDITGKQIIKQMTWQPPAGMSSKQITKEINIIAVNFEQEVLSDSSNSENVKLVDFLTMYYEMVEHTLSPTTLSLYKSVFERDILPQLGHMKLKDIKPIHVQKLIQHFSSPNLRSNGKKLSSASISRYLTALKSVMTKAYKLGLIDQNPTDSRKLEIPQVIMPDIDIFTEEEIKHMLGCLKLEKVSLQVLVQLAMVTGCRRGELTALRWASIDMENFIISVTESSYKLKGEPSTTKAPKTKSSIRNIAIPPYIINLLLEHKDEQSLKKLRLGDKWIDGDWIFTQWDGKLMHPHTPTKQFKKFLENHNIPLRKLHAVRHTSATILLENGTSIKTVAARLGHVQLSTTNRYVHATQKSDNKAAQVFEFLNTV